MKEQWDSDQSVAKEMCNASIEEVVVQLKAENIKTAWVGYCLVRRGVTLVAESAKGDVASFLQCLEHAIIWGQQDWHKKAEKKR